MRRKFRRALKNLNKAYDFPNPTREDAFFRSLEEKTKKKSLFFLILEHRAIVCQAAAVCTVVIIMAGGYGIYQNYRNGSGSIPIADIEDSVGETDMSSEVEEQTSSADTQETFSAVDETTTEAVVSAITDLPVVPQSETIVHTTEIRQNSQQQATTIVIRKTQNQQTTKATAMTRKETKETTRTSQATTTTKRTTKTTATATTTAKPASTQTTASSTVTTMVSSGGQAPPSNEVNNGATTVPPTGDEETEVTADYRVTPAYRYEKTDTIINIKSEPVGPSDDVKPISPWMIQADCSDQIVSGTVIGLTYTRIGNELWTQVDLVITDVYDGTLRQGDKISVYEKGGYIPLSEYLALYPELSSMFPITDEEIQNMTCFDPDMQETSSALGETCLYFLQEGSSAVPAGAYQYVSNADVSRYQWNGSSLVNVLYRSNTFQEEELVEYLRR